MTYTEPVPGLPRSEPAPPRNARSIHCGPELRKKYTVLLLYPEYLTKTYGVDTILIWLEAKDHQEAVWKAQLEAVDSQILPVLDPKDFSSLFVAKGWVENEIS